MLLPVVVLLREDNLVIYNGGELIWDLVDVITRVVLVDVWIPVVEVAHHTVPLDVRKRVLDVEERAQDVLLNVGEGATGSAQEDVVRNVKAAVWEIAIHRAAVHAKMHVKVARAVLDVIIHAILHALTRVVPIALQHVTEHALSDALHVAPTAHHHV